MCNIGTQSLLAAVLGLTGACGERDMLGGPGSGPSLTTAGSGDPDATSDGDESGGSSGGGESGSTGGGDDGAGSSSGGDPSTTDDSSGGGSSGGSSTGADPTDGGAVLDPPAGESSGGSGGPTGSGVMVTTPSGYQYRIIHPGGTGPFEFLLVFSGVEGGAAMTSNLQQLGGSTNTGHMLRAVVDGAQYNLDQQVGGDVLDDVRAKYDVDNDRTYVLSESAGSGSGFVVAMATRQSYVAAFWGNDINVSVDPERTSAELGFEPYGNCGPGGEFVGCNHVVDAMAAAGYRLPPPAPYNGPGAGTHGDINQFIAALSWFNGKTRQ